MHANRKPAPYDVVFCTKTNSIIDILNPAIDTKALLAQLSVQYGPDLIILGSAEAMRRYENAFKTEPAEITEERYTEMLNVLPPVAWTNANGESFKISERLAGAVTAIFVRIGERYVTFHDDIRTPHEECCRRAAEFLQSNPPT